MRPFLLAALLALSAFVSGCSDGGSSSDGEATDDPIVPANNTTMEPLHFQEDVPVGADPFNFVPVVTPVGGGVPCSTDVSSCFFYEFTVQNGTVDVVATLAWELAANDFDLYLYQGDTQISQDGINSIPPAVGPPPTTQVLRHSGLVPGTYEFWVVAWNSVNDGFTLDVVFE